MKKLSKFLETIAICSEKMIIRFFILVLSAALGILLLVVFTNYCEDWLVECLDLGQNSRLIVSFKIIFLGLFVFISLWYFRTYDTKKQLAKSEEQINQNNYFQGLDNLVSNESLKVEIGVQQLLELSKVVKKYKDDIKFTFIKRLKSPLSKEEGRYFSYAQYIVGWLSKNYHFTELDLDGCNFDYQEFSIETNFDIFRNKKNILKQLNFVEANLNGTNLYEACLIRANLGGAYLNQANLHKANLDESYLGKAYLRGAYLRGANLHKANLHTAYLDGANLSGANLSGANLSGANLSGTDLSGANLSGANLSGTDLSGADLSGANLSGADLSGAILAGAFFDQIHRPLGVNFGELGYKLEGTMIDSTRCYRLVKENS